MGRAKGSASAVATSTRSVLAERKPANPQAVALSAIIRSMGAVASNVNELQDYLFEVDALASQTAAGRGGRLFTAFEDLLRAQKLSLSPNFEDRHLAEVTSDNALHHAGVLIATFDPESLMLAPLRRALAEYGRTRGVEQLAYLRERGLLAGIPESQLQEWERDAGQGYVQAFATAKSAFSKKGEARPPWRALSLMARAASARQSLMDAPVPGSEAEGARTLAVSKADKLLKNGRAYLADINGLKTSDQISRTGPQDVTFVQAVAEALTSPQAAALNEEMARSHVVERHRQLVNAGTEAESQTLALAVADSRWLDLLMNYSVTITCSAGESTLALNSEGQIIFFGPEVADNAIRAGHHQAFDEVVTHELVHTTQPKPVGSPLADRGHPQAVALKSRHYIFEDQLLEGATQAQTNYLRRLHDRDYEGAVTNIYPTFVAMVDEVQRVSGVAPETYYRQLSATPANLRTAYLSKCLLGREDERTQRDVFESLLKANVEAENAAAEAGGFTDTILASHRVLTRKILADLRGQ